LLTSSDAPCRKSQADLKKTVSSASLKEAELTTNISELEAAAQRAETLHAAKVKQLYQKIQVLEAEACAQESQQTKDVEQVSSHIHRAREARQEADQLQEQLREAETVCLSHEVVACPVKQIVFWTGPAEGHSAIVVNLIPNLCTHCKH
jgi:vacuolar-type H+-ATPase subunit I/STV1